ncbi:MAG TPA: cupin domain-containing protein [Mycobacterium sp.]|jgi:quercetin dioxygenase-like cupin family protein|nr:cupin domain-containing protein [Mycobacterium sp.]
MTLLPFVVSADRSQNAPWQVLAGGDRTGGSVTFGEARVPPRGSGPARHVHSREDEAIFIIEGVLTVEVGPDRYEAGPGTLTWLPRGVPHAFGNLGDEPVWAFGVITPSGLEGMFSEIGAYLARLHGPPDEQVIADINARYGVTPVGPPIS